MAEALLPDEGDAEVAERRASSLSVLSGHSHRSSPTADDLDYVSGRSSITELLASEVADAVEKAKEAARSVAELRHLLDRERVVVEEANEEERRLRVALEAARAAANRAESECATARELADEEHQRAEVAEAAFSDASSRAVGASDRAGSATARAEREREDADLEKERADRAEAELARVLADSRREET